MENLKKKIQKLSKATYTYTIENKDLKAIVDNLTHKEEIEKNRDISKIWIHIDMGQGKTSIKSVDYPSNV